MNANPARMEVATTDTLQLTAWVGARDVLLTLILEAKQFFQVQPRPDHDTALYHLSYSAWLVLPELCAKCDHSRSPMPSDEHV